MERHAPTFWMECSTDPGLRYHDQQTAFRETTGCLALPSKAGQKIILFWIMCRLSGLGTPGLPKSICPNNHFGIPLKCFGHRTTQTRTHKGGAQCAHLLDGSVAPTDATAVPELRMCSIGAYMCHSGRLGWSGISGLRQSRNGSSGHAAISEQILAMRLSSSL